MLARRGAHLLEVDEVDAHDRGKALLAEAEKLIDGVLAVAPNLERYCLQGSIRKRKLKLATDGDLDMALQKMAAAYQSAERFVGESGGRLYYPALSVLHATLLRQLLGTVTEAELAAARARIEVVRQELGSPGFQPRDFWDRVAPLDLALTEAMLNAACDSTRQSDTDFDKSREDYQALLAYSSRRERGSVLDTLDTLTDFLGRLPSRRQGVHTARAKELVKRLKRLADELRRLQ